MFYTLMHVLTISTNTFKYLFLILLSLCVCAFSFTHAQTSDVKDPDDFMSDDDFVSYLLEVLGEDEVDPASDYDEEDNEGELEDRPGVLYEVVSSTSSSVTLETTYTVPSRNQEDSFRIMWYTDAWDAFEDRSSSATEAFISYTTVSPRYDSAGRATFTLNNLLVDSTYYLVVTPASEMHTYTSNKKSSVEEIKVTTDTGSVTTSAGYDFLYDTLFDRDRFHTYFRDGENSAFFLGLLLDRIQNMSSSEQEHMIRGMSKNIVDMKQSGFIHLGLDYDGFVAVLDDAAEKSGSSYTRTSGSQRYIPTVNDDLEITWQAFPAKEPGKRVIVFRTNFSEVGVSRATWHMDLGTVHGCDRTQCDRFSYVFDDNQTHYIDINIVYQSGEGYDSSNDRIKIDL